MMRRCIQSQKLDRLTRRLPHDVFEHIDNYHATSHRTRIQKKSEKRRR